MTVQVPPVFRSSPEATAERGSSGPHAVHELPQSGPGPAASSWPAAAGSEYHSTAPTSAAAAVALVRDGEPLWGQVAAANTASLQAFLAEGYRPVAAEVLFSS